MDIPSFRKNRIIWLILIVLISLGLVSVALAAAGHAGRSVTDGQAAPPQTQGGGKPGASMPPSPMLTSYQPTVNQSKPDPSLEQMRQQAMAAAQVESLRTSPNSPSYVTDDEAGNASPSQAPQGAGTMYLPGGIVVDTFLDRIYGNVNSWSTVIVSRPSDNAYGAAEADQKGFFWTSLFDGGNQGTQVGINPGDVLDINGNTFTVGQEPQGEIDVVNDSISGTIPGDTGSTAITVTLGLYGAPSMAFGIYPGVTDGSGHFSITFSQDIGPENFATVDYKVGGIFQRTSFFPQNTFLVQPHSYLQGRGTISGYAPRGSDLSAIVYVGDSGDIRWQGGGIKANYPYGWFTFPEVELENGDRVEVYFQGGPVETHYVSSTDIQFPDNYTVSGFTAANRLVRVSFLQWLTTDYHYYETQTTSLPNGNFSVSFSVVIRPDTRLEVAVIDDYGLGSYTITGKPYVEAIITYDSDYDCVMGRVDVPNTPVVFNLIKPTEVFTRTLNPSDPGNRVGGDFCYLMRQGGKPVNFDAGDIVRLSTPDWSWQVIVRAYHWVAYAEDNHIEGEIFSGQIGEVALRLYPTDYTFLSHIPTVEARTVATPSYTLQFDAFDVRAGIYVDTISYDENGFANRSTERNHYFQIIDGHAVSGHSAPDEDITVFVWASDPLKPACRLTNNYDYDPSPVYFYFDLNACRQSPPLQPGNVVEVDYGWHTTDDRWLTYQPVSVQGDPDTNMLTGSGMEGMLEFYGGNDQASFDLMAPTLNSTAYLNTLDAANYNLSWGDRVNLYYRDRSGNLLNSYIKFYPLQPTMQVNYAHDWVEGQYYPGIGLSIRVTDKWGVIKGTALGETGAIPWWGGETGFSTNYNVRWDGIPPDIRPTDFVYVELVNGHSAGLQVGTINGALNLDTNTFDGQIIGDWLTFPVNGDCGVWVDGGPGMGFTTTIAGGFSCDFSPFKIKPGMDVGVSYVDQDGNRVYNVFNVPAPHLNINLEPQGEPANLNNYAFRVHYSNNGWATASGVLITQTFEGMTYLSDTSGFSRMSTGAQGSTIVWDVGDLPYNRYTDNSFFVFVRIDDLSSVSTSIDISTATSYYQGDEQNKHSEWGALVVPNNSDLNIWKGAWTGDPVPGEEFVYSVRVCNSGSASSSEVLITDTLPVFTTLRDWWGQYPGWEEVYTSTHELVVSRPTVPGNWCGEVYINVQLSAQAQNGMELINYAETWASSDVNPLDNSTAFPHNVGSPSYNLHMEPNWTYGQFVQGGEIGYEFGFSNWGNMPMPGTLLTTTLPQDTVFMFAYSWDWSGWYIITPTVIGNGYLVWDFDTFNNGYYQNLGIRLKIDAQAPVGTPLVLDNHITGDVLEWRYDDNVMEYNDIVHENGANLRVDKHSNWGWNGEGELWYELRILNVGTRDLVSPTVTDTYDISTEVTDCRWNHGPFLRCEVDAVNHQVKYTLDHLNSGETAGAMLTVGLDNVGQQGLAFVNQAEISDFGDIDLDDNFDEVTSYTGPDVFVRKWLKVGELRAGELVTYTVEFGNSNRGPWNGDGSVGSHITDTLPAGMTFVKAVLYNDPQGTWQPEITGQRLVWNAWTMWADQTWTFDLVVRLDADLSPGTELTNVIEAWGDSPTDIDPIPANNTFRYSLYSVLNRLLMPLVIKSP
jgi:uncharacterized repeat protein (TIGR01451 family)